MDFDFSSYNQDFELFTKNLPDFERRYLFNLSEKEKHDLFSDVLKSFYYKELTFEKSLYLFIKIALESLTSKCHDFYLSLFRDLPIEKAKKLAKESVIREKHTLNSKLTYGEIDFFSFLSILEIVNPSKNDVLVDLGHGTGRAIVCASLLYGSLLKKIIGIEIIPELNLGSLEIIENLKSILNSNAFFSGHSLDLVVQEGDFTTNDYFNWSDVGNIDYLCLFFIVFN